MAEVPSTVALNFMDIQDLGSIGEFVAAIATLATLIYVALQIRKIPSNFDSVAPLHSGMDYPPPLILFMWKTILSFFRKVWLESLLNHMRSWDSNS